MAGVRLVVQLIGAIALMSAPAFAQQAPPRTAFGAPSLEGLWTNNTATPLERPAMFDAATTTPEREAAFVKASRDGFLSDNSDGIGGRQSEYWEVAGAMTHINGEIRTSLIVDPPNGKMPINAAGKALLAKSQANMLQLYDDPEGRPSPERCLVGGSGSTGAPIFTARYNGQYKFVQTRDHLVISMEQNGQVRVIPMHEEPRSSERRWAGYSVGHWEGDTLVVKTDGFAHGDAYKPAAPLYISENARVTERFTRISPGEILYQFTVEDPDIFIQPWRTEQVFSATNSMMLEVACHEGNYSLPGILSGGRAIERRKAKRN